MTFSFPLLLFMAISHVNIICVLFVVPSGKLLVNIYCVMHYTLHGLLVITRCGGQKEIRRQKSLDCLTNWLTWIKFLYQFCLAVWRDTEIVQCLKHGSYIACSHILSKSFLTVLLCSLSICCHDSIVKLRHFCYKS